MSPKKIFVYFAYYLLSLASFDSPQECCIEIPFTEDYKLLFHLCVWISCEVTDSKVTFNLKRFRQDWIKNFQRCDLRIDAKLSPFLRSSFFIFLQDTTAINNLRKKVFFRTRRLFTLTLTRTACDLDPYMLNNRLGCLTLKKLCLKSFYLLETTFFLSAIFLRIFLLSGFVSGVWKIFEGTTISGVRPWVSE